MSKQITFIKQCCTSTQQLYVPTHRPPANTPPPAPTAAKSAKCPPCPPIRPSTAKSPPVPTTAAITNRPPHTRKQPPPQSLANSHDLSSNTRDLSYSAHTSTREFAAPLPSRKSPQIPKITVQTIRPTQAHSPSPISHDLVQAVLLSTIHYPLSTIHYPLSTIHYPLSTIHYPLSTIHYPLSTGVH